MNDGSVIEHTATHLTACATKPAERNEMPRTGPTPHMLTRFCLSDLIQNATEVVGL